MNYKAMGATPSFRRNLKFSAPKKYRKHRNLDYTENFVMYSRLHYLSAECTEIIWKAPPYLLSIQIFYVYEHFREHR